MKDIKEISENIKNNFYKRTGYTIDRNTILDNYIMASSDGIHMSYQEIENNKNPHLYTNLKDDEIDDLGLLVNIPRRDGEDYETYHYRLLNWKKHYERGNRKSIESSLLNLRYSSNAQYVPLTQGAGTGTVYIIPKEYSDENNKKAIIEAQLRLDEVVSPDSYIEFLIVKPIPIRLTINLLTYKDTDVKNIKNIIEIEIKDYINNLAPGEVLSIIDIERIGINKDHIKYFSVVNMYVNDEIYNEYEIVQTIKSKMLLDSIEWIVMEEGELIVKQD